jgi:hypothetical protein
LAEQGLQDYSHLHFHLHLKNLPSHNFKFEDKTIQITNFASLYPNADYFIEPS